MGDNSHFLFFICYLAVFCPGKVPTVSVISFTAVQYLIPIHKWNSVNSSLSPRLVLSLLFVRSFIHSFIHSFRECKWGRSREREKDRIPRESQAASALPARSLTWGSNPRNREIRT